MGAFELVFVSASGVHGFSLRSYEAERLEVLSNGMDVGHPGARAFPIARSISKKSHATMSSSPLYFYSLKLIGGLLGYA